MKRSLLILSLFISSSAWARPLVTENVETNGLLSFETTLGGSQRFDTFESPKTTYKSIDIPVRFRLGIHNKADLGITLQHFGQTIETPSSEFTGSQTALITSHLKWRLNNHIGLMGLWHYHAQEDGSENLPIGRGDDLEIFALLKAPMALPVYLNVGYMFREDYKSHLGVQGGFQHTVKPGDVFTTRASVEIPLRYHFSLLNEWLYYNVAKKEISGVETLDSKGEALDALVGVTWSAFNWNMGLGAAFGLLDESHTSFDLERGAGDVTYKLSLAYRLAPKTATP